MEEIEEKRRVASWALLRKLYNNGTQDIYDLISDFIKYTIFKESLREFDVFTLTCQVNKVFCVKLIDAVVKRALKKLHLTVVNGIYKCNPNDYADMSVFTAAINETTQNSTDMLNRLTDYVEKDLDKKLNTDERQNLMRAFNLFMLDKKEKSDYVELIAKFFVHCNQDISLRGQLNNIKEGVVLFSGLNYNAKTENASKKWTDDICIYLDTEVLFHMAGYNGETYKQLFYDFYNLVTEINSDSINKTGVKRIKLYYFEQTEDEYRNFFNIAEDIVTGKVPLVPSVTAMYSITKGCRNACDVSEKKVEFESLLKTHSISKYEKDDGFYSDADIKYNIESEEIVKKYEELFPKISAKDIQNSLISLSHVFVLRKGKVDSYFERSKHLLLTDNFITRHIAWDDSIKAISGNVLCTDLYYFTDRLWCRLGKSFGLNTSPKAYDVISRAQIFLSSRINASITDEYELLLTKYKNKEVDKEHVLEVLSELRSKVMNPEDIQTESNIDAALEAISGRNIESYIQEKERRQIEHNELLLEKNELKQKLAESEEDRNREKEIHKKMLAKKDVELMKKQKEVQHNANILIAYAQATTEMTQKRESFKKKRNKFICEKRKTAFRWLLRRLIIALVFIVVAWGGNMLVKIYSGNSLSGIWDYVLCIVPAIISQIVPIIRTFAFGATDGKEAFLYAFNVKSISAKRSLIKAFGEAPSFDKIFRDKLRDLESQTN